MDIRTEINHLKISAKNFREFRELMMEAEKEAQQLHATLQKLSCFEFDLELSIEEN